MAAKPIPKKSALTTDQAVEHINANGLVTNEHGPVRVRKVAPGMVAIVITPPADPVVKISFAPIPVPKKPAPVQVETVEAGTDWEEKRVRLSSKTPQEANTLRAALIAKSKKGVCDRCSKVGPIARKEHVREPEFYCEVAMIPRVLTCWTCWTAEVDRQARAMVVMSRIVKRVGRERAVEFAKHYPKMLSDEKVLATFETKLGITDAK